MLPGTLLIFSAIAALALIVSQSLDRRAPITKFACSTLLLMMPATFAASLGFMLPVATAANTIVFGTRMIAIKDMVKVGIILDMAGILIISLLCYLYLI